MNLFFSPLNTCYMTRVFWTMNNEMIGEAIPDLQRFIVETEDQFLPAISKEHNEISKRKSKAWSSCRSSAWLAPYPTKIQSPTFPCCDITKIQCWAAPPSCHQRTTTGRLTSELCHLVILCPRSRHAASQNMSCFRSMHPIWREQCNPILWRGAGRCGVSGCTWQPAQLRLFWNPWVASPAEPWQQRVQPQH